MAFTLLGLGTALPTGTIDQSEAADYAARLCCHTPRQQRMLHTIYRQSTVRRRGAFWLKCRRALLQRPTPIHCSKTRPRLHFQWRRFMLRRRALTIAALRRHSVWMFIADMRYRWHAAHRPRHSLMLTLLQKRSIISLLFRVRASPRRDWTFNS